MGGTRKQDHSFFEGTMLAARILIEELIRQGVTDFCIAPGSRSTPLSVAIAENPKANNIVHFDERGLGFYALGLAKSKGRPVAVIVTSGTAVANLMPAALEASMDNVPLILLTADRPTELRESWANQTVDQVKIFGSFVRWQTDLPCYDTNLIPNYLVTTIAQGVYRASNSPSGPVQINCMFREPFLENEDAPVPVWSSTFYSTLKHHVLESTLKEVSHALQKEEKGVIVLANLDHTTDLAPIFKLARKLDWPVIADVLSGARCDDANMIPYFHSLFEKGDFQANFILQFGSKTVGRETLGWIKNCHPKRYMMVAPHPFRQDPNHHVTDRIESDPSSFARELLFFIAKNKKESNWSLETDAFYPLLDDFFKKLPYLSEPGLFFSLSKMLSPDTALYIANSMPIRDAERYFFPKTPVGEVFANRGVSGIDGNIATAVGIANGLKKPVIAILGDQTTLHDLNSLALIKQSIYPIILIVINNYGGGIFSFLPIREKKEVLDSHFANVHPFTFENAATMFSIPYLNLDDEELLRKVLAQKQSCILEMTTDREENYCLHQEIKELLKGSLTCSIK